MHAWLVCVSVCVCVHTWGPGAHTAAPTGHHQAERGSSLQREAAHCQKGVSTTHSPAASPHGLQGAQPQCWCSSLHIHRMRGVCTWQHPQQCSCRSIRTYRSAYTYVQGNQVYTTPFGMPLCADPNACAQPKDTLVQHAHSLASPLSKHTRTLLTRIFPHTRAHNKGGAASNNSNCKGAT